MKLNVEPPSPIDHIEVERRFEPKAFFVDCDAKTAYADSPKLETTFTARTFGDLDTSFFEALLEWAGVAGIGAPTPVKCIMNDPATVLFFSDGKKVVSKAHGGDTYDPLFGIMACALRKTSNNRERIDNWEVVIAFLSCFLADAKECRVIADMLNTTADALDLDGVGDQVTGRDVSDSAFEKALYENEVW